MFKKIQEVINETTQKISEKEVSELNNFSRKIAKNAEQIVPSRVYRDSARQRLMASMFAHRMPGWHNIFEFFWYKRNTSVAIVAAFLVFTSVFSFVSHPFLTSAHETNILKISGNVWVERGMNRILAKDGEVVQAGDKIVTTEGSKAEIHFLDYSVARLDSGTKLTIQETPSNENEIKSKPTQLEVVEGKVWTNSLKTKSTPNFEVITPHGSVSANTASFAVEVEDDGTEVMVNSKEAKIIVNNAEDTLGEGGKIKMQKSRLIVPIDEKTNDEWVQENEQADEKHMQEVKTKATAELKNDTGALPGDPLYSLKKITENAKVTLTFNDEEKKKLEDQITETRLAEATILMEDGRLDEATAILNGLGQEVGDNDIHQKVGQIVDSSNTQNINLEVLSNLDQNKLLGGDAGEIKPEN